MKKPVTFVNIDLRALKSNIRCIKRRLPQKTKILFVVKADAYGHGMTEVARVAETCPEVVYFGVANALEALQLRKANIKKPILILSPPHPSEYKTLIKENITLSISSLEEAAQIEGEGKKLGKKPRVHVELDTGMGRLGIRYMQALKFLFSIQAMKGLQLEGAFSHFPSADEVSKKYSRKQLELFKKVMEYFQEMYPKQLKFIHMANSAGLMNYEDAHFNLVRPGILAYGIHPASKKLPEGLKPVLSFKTHVVLVKNLESGATVSYARTYKTRKETHIATIPVGYSSGYPIQLSNCAEAVVGGHAYPVVGRVTMDHLMLDIGPVSEVKRWDEVSLIGDGVSVEQLARLSGTIPYDILCSINPRIPRIYKI